MNYIFSASNENYQPPALNSFYRIADKQDYVTAGTWPTNFVEVSDDVFNEFSGQAPSGKQCGSDADGNPVWVDLPPLTQAQQVTIAEQKKSALLAEANAFTGPWQTQLLLGIISDEDKASLTVWMKYYQQVQAIDISKAPEITFPERPV